MKMIDKIVSASHGVSVEITGRTCLFQIFIGESAGGLTLFQTGFLYNKVFLGP